MTMTIPALTALAAGQVVQAADLTAMASACTFLLTKPIARVHMTTSGQTLTATTGSAINYNTADFDTDSMWGGAGTATLTARTPGFYKARYTVCQNGITGNAWVLLTTGAANPIGAGVTTKYLPSYVFGNTNSWQLGAAGLIPAYMYIGDYVTVWFGGNIGATVQVSPLGPSLSMEYVSI